MWIIITFPRIRSEDLVAIFPCLFPWHFRSPMGDLIRTGTGAWELWDLSALRDRSSMSWRGGPSGETPWVKPQWKWWISIWLVYWMIARICVASWCFTILSVSNRFCFGITLNNFHLLFLSFPSSDLPVMFPVVSSLYIYINVHIWMIYDIVI